MRDLQIVLSTNVFGFPRLKGSNQNELIQLFRKPWKESIGHPDPWLHGANIEIARRPFPFFDIESVDMSRAATQINEDAKLGSSSGIDFLFGNDPERTRQRLRKKPETPTAPT